VFEGPGNGELKWRSRGLWPTRLAARALVQQGRSTNHPQAINFTGRRKWEKMGLFGTIFEGSSPISQYSTTKRLALGGGVAARLKLLVHA
jgi:hypothetical protein